MNNVRMLLLSGIFVMTSMADVALVVPAGEELWINYPAEQGQLSPKKKAVSACKALRDHRRHISSSKAWQLKYEELYTQCSSETIEESIKRLQRQLAKDRQRWERLKK